MKTTVLIVSILLSTLFSNVLLAQGKNEFKIAYGYSGIDFYHIGLQFGDGPYDSTSGTYSINYNRRINKRVSVGIQTNYTIISDKFEVKEIGDFYDGVYYPDQVVYKEYVDINNIVYPLAKFDFRYINKPKFEMYSSAMLGLISIEEGIPYHITGLGFRIGEKHAFVAELGFGYGHLISAGYSVKL